MQEEYDSWSNVFSKDGATPNREINDSDFVIDDGKDYISGKIVESNIHLIDEEKITDIAASIIEEFDGQLCDNNLIVPDSEREGLESEAAIYGSTYYTLEDSIKDIIKKSLEV